MHTHILTFVFLCVKYLVAHKIFGVPATINCANYVYFLALAELSKIPNPKMLTIFTGVPLFVVDCLWLLL